MLFMPFLGLLTGLAIARAAALLEEIDPTSVQPQIRHGPKCSLENGRLLK